MLDFSPFGFLAKPLASTVGSFRSSMTGACSFCITGGTGIYEVKGESGNGKGENGERKGESGEGNAVYDLLGREVYNPCGGVYIVNGKKFIVR